MSHLIPMNNAIGRFIPQLKRLTIRYCRNGGSSKGIRQAAVKGNKLMMIPHP